MASWSAMRVAAASASGPSAAMTGRASSSSRARVLAGLTNDSWAGPHSVAISSSAAATASRSADAGGQQLQVGGELEHRGQQRPQGRVPDAGLRQRHVRRAGAGAGGPQRGVLRPDADQRDAAAGGLVGGRDRVAAGARAGGDHGDVARPAPHRQRRTGDDVHRDRAAGAEQRPEHGGGHRALAAGHDDQPARPAAVGDPAEAGLRGQPGGLADLRAGARDRGQQAAGIAGAQELEVVEDLLGDLGAGHRDTAIDSAPPQFRCRASSSSSTGMPSRTGKARSQVGAQQLARLLVHGQRAVVGVGAGQDGQQLRVQPQRPSGRPVRRSGHARTIPSTRSVSSVMRAASGASTLSRSSGSVLRRAG